MRSNLQWGACAYGLQGVKGADMVAEFASKRL